MWAIKIPKRSDFCGCPPCPLCFNWVDGEKNVTGIDKMAWDLLGRDYTPKERPTLQAAAERIHEANLNRQPEKGYLERVEEDNHRMANNLMMKEIAQIAKAKKFAPPRLNPICLDNIEDRKNLEPKDPVKEESKEEAFAEMTLYSAMLGGGLSTKILREKRRQDRFQDERLQGHRRSGMNWDPSEDSALRGGFNGSDGVAELSKRHERSPLAIEMRLEKLGIIPKKSRPELDPYYVPQNLGNG